MSNRNYLSSALLLTALLAPTTGCVTEENDPGALEFRETGMCLPPCIPTNSPRANDFGLADFDLTAQEPNSDGVYLVGIEDPNDALYALGTVGQDLAAFNGGTLVAKGGALVGWEIVVTRGGVQERAKIEGFDRNIPSWATGAAAFSTYAISYSDPADPAAPKSICPGVANFYHKAVTVLVGETYDGETKTVNENMPGWITLACEDEAVFKMKKLNYHPGANFNGMGLSATPDQRQATLKMITADYCGTGASYTNQNTPLRWRNASLTVDTYAVGALIEAAWDENGALCLSTQRTVTPFSPHVECPGQLPQCDENNLPPGAEWITWYNGG